MTQLMLRRPSPFFRAQARLALPIFLMTLLALGTSGCSRTQSWTEDVELSDGRVVTVERTVTRGPDEFFQPGKGGTVGSTLRFRHHRKDITFEDPGEHISSLVLILDYVDGAPVVVKPIDMPSDCQKYGYPPESLIAFRYSEGRWSPMSVAKLPKSWKINLIGTHSELRYVDSDPNAVYGQTSSEARGEERAFLAGKREYAAALARSRSAPPNRARAELGDSLQELISYYTEERGACGRFQVLADARRDARRAAIDDAIRNAQTREAVLESESVTPREVPHQEYYDKFGFNGRGNAFLVDSCFGIVRRFRTNTNLVGQTTDQATYSTEIVLEAPSDTYSPIEFSRSFESPFVACDDADLYLTFRKGPSIRMVWLSREGTPQGAANVVIPDNGAATADGQWLHLWNIVPEQGEVTFSLVKAQAPETRPGNHTILHERRYRVSLEPRE